MVAIKHELDTVQQVKEEIEELREYVDRLEEHTHRRKLRLLEQVCSLNYLPCCVIKYLNFISLFMYKPKHQEPTTNNPEPDNHTTKKPPRTTRTSIHPATQNHWRQKLPPWRMLFGLASVSVHTQTNLSPITTWKLDNRILLSEFQYKKYLTEICLSVLHTYRRLLHQRILNISYLISFVLFIFISSVAKSNKYMRKMLIQLLFCSISLIWNMVSDIRTHSSIRTYLIVSLPLSFN